jgi:ferredoxin-type protein NapH
MALLELLGEYPYTTKYTKVRFAFNVISAITLVIFPVFHLIKMDFANGNYYLWGHYTTNWTKPAIWTFSLWIALYTVTFVINYFYGRFFCSFICTEGWLIRGVKVLYDRLYRHGKKLQFNIIVFVLNTILTLILLNWIVDLSVLFKPYHPAFWWVSFLTYGLIALNYLAIGWLRQKWCRYFCPIGLYLEVFNQKMRWRITYDQKTCTECLECVRACPIALDPRKLKDELDTTSGLKACYMCGKCVDACMTDFRKHGEEKQALHISKVDDEGNVKDLF